MRKQLMIRWCTCLVETVSCRVRGYLVKECVEKLGGCNVAAHQSGSERGWVGTQVDGGWAYAFHILGGGLGIGACIAILDLAG